MFCGGDLAGTAETAVEAVNDGKVAAWSIHKFLQDNQIPKETRLPRFYSPIDQVDLSVEVIQFLLRSLCHNRKLTADVRPQICESIRVGVGSSGDHLAHDKEGIRTGVPLTRV